MKVVVGGNSLSGNLTGIGIYTRGLVRGLSERSEIDELRLLCHGRLGAPIRTATEIGDLQAGDESVQARDHFAGKVRAVASKSRIIVGLYGLVTSLSSRLALRHYGVDDIYHSPDFQIFPFPGKKVVTIPDLSTIRYPEYHPASRVAYINSHIRRAVDHCDHIVAISDFVQQEINETLDVPREKITTIYPGIDAAFSPVSKSDFEAAKIAPRLDYKRYFIFISTIEPRKNIIRLLCAYKHYREIEGESSFPLVVIGLPGWNSADIHREISKMAADGYVHYLGYVDRETLRLLLAGARGLLFPSLYEGFGLPVMEAMRSGTAVLTSKKSAMSEISAGAALFTDPLDTDEMLARILQLHRDNALVESLEVKGLDRSRKFTWESCARQTVDLYKEMCSD